MLCKSMMSTCPLIPHPYVIIFLKPATGFGLGARSMHCGHVFVKMVVQSLEILHHLSATLNDKVAPRLWSPCSRRMSLYRRSMYDKRLILSRSVVGDCNGCSSSLLSAPTSSSPSAVGCLLLFFRLRVVETRSTRTCSPPTDTMPYFLSHAAIWIKPALFSADRVSPLCKRRQAVRIISHFSFIIIDEFEPFTRNDDSAAW